ncbi:T9SS type A sorting domain-containing protein [Maribellus comscasis]|uniref:T9SS type A sorting domain-containing protein n=1 Tax=Maribellus comscasis TaxID=2681766 RepID=A0A6I6KCL0_9BACT|nr:T9SS type A sorting domain-containing protein [Maribellus comscasis]QGY47994.1 T9SS type A sorting domain-containing protein [Maribellus comscasis]
MWNGAYVGTFINAYDSRSLSISPNPSIGEVTLAIESSDEKELITEEWELEIYNNSQTLKGAKTKIKGKEYKLNTSGWKDGVYMVRITYKDEILTGKLVVKR